ncbi:MAG: hypothetical protein JXA42_11870 [Anaerolineales bacterium]|nr:hypothetical protein [Anaerolineales bacterium]
MCCKISERLRDPTGLYTKEPAPIGEPAQEEELTPSEGLVLTKVGANRRTHINSRVDPGRGGDSYYTGGSHHANPSSKSRAE